MLALGGREGGNNLENIKNILGGNNVGEVCNRKF